MSIEKFCQREVCTVGPRDTARIAAEQMEKNGVGCLVVVDRAKPVGIVTDRQLALELLCNRLDPGAIRVEEVASRGVEKIEKDASFQDATQLMRQSGLRRLPVVDKKGKLFGIITSDDLMQVAVGELAQLGAALRAQAPLERLERRES